MFGVTEWITLAKRSLIRSPPLIVSCDLGTYSWHLTGAIPSRCTRNFLCDIASPGNRAKRGKKNFDGALKPTGDYQFFSHYDRIFGTIRTMNKLVYTLVSARNRL